MVRFLLEKGADHITKDKTGRDGLEIARHLKRNTIILILEEHIALIHFQGKIRSVKSQDVCFVFN